MQNLGRQTESIMVFSKVAYCACSNRSECHRLEASQKRRYNFRSVICEVDCTCLISGEVFTRTCIFLARNITSLLIGSVNDNIR